MSYCLNLGVNNLKLYSQFWVEEMSPFLLQTFMIDLLFYIFATNAARKYRFCVAGLDLSDYFIVVMCVVTHLQA
jgi:hypothetical protein